MDVPAGIAINDYLAGLQPDHRLEERSPNKHGESSSLAAPAFWNLLQSSLKLFKDLIAKVLQVSVIAVSVKPYFDPITRHLDNNLIRLEIWIFDIGIDDQDFKNASKNAIADTKLERYVTSILEDTISQLKVIEQRIEHMSAIVSRISEGRDQKFGFRKRNGQLDEVLRQVENRCEQIASAVRCLVDLTEAIRMDLATRYQRGPLAGLRQRVLSNREQFQMTTNPNTDPISRHEAEDLPLLARIDPAAVEESSPWTRKTLLTLDGGGTKNYSTLLILRVLMSKIADIEQTQSPSARHSAYPLELRHKDSRSLPEPITSAYFPCHYFDYIAGSGFGGILAIMLGRLRMTVDECLEAYELLTETVLASPRKLYKRMPLAKSGEKYDHRLLESGLKSMIKAKGLGSSFPQSNEDMCRTIVIALRLRSVNGAPLPHLFRSYHHPKSRSHAIMERNPGTPDEYQIWQVGRATCAAPLYLKPMTLQEEDGTTTYIDGGYLNSNPSVEAYNSVKQLYRQDPLTVKVLVSIGTGKDLEADQKRNPAPKRYSLARASPIREYSSERTHQDLLDLTRNSAEYFRLNVEHGLGNMKFDEWKGKKGDTTLQLIRTMTEDYLKSPEGEALITESAMHLVEIRRDRSNWQPDLDHWERFCYGVEYYCRVNSCSDVEAYTRQNLRNHLERFHAIEPDRLEAMLDEANFFY